MTDLAYADAQMTSIRNGLMHRVYAWMMAGLLVTAAVAMVVAGNDAFMTAIFGNLFVLWGLIIAELALAWILSANIHRLSIATATIMFLTYSAINGLTMAAIFWIYTTASIASTFFITAGTFGAMSLYGYTTKRDLSGWGNFLLMALIGLILASAVNIFLGNSTLYWIITYVGVLVFVALTAFDTQKIKSVAAEVTNETDAGRLAIIGALLLYLDFVGLFLYLLRIFGSRRK
jgi:uncharacterized protein